MDFDDILQDIGEFGRYQQLLLIIVILPSLIPGGFHGFSQIFSVGVPEDYWCRLPPSLCQNFTENDAKKYFLPQEGAGNATRHSQCRMFDVDPDQFLDLVTNLTVPRSTPTIPCQHGWEYDRSVYRSTIATDWDLVCDKDFFPTLSLFINTVGTLVGSLIFGYLIDRIGRKKTFFLVLAIQIASGLATAAAPEFWTFCFFRFFNGLTLIPSWIIPFILCMELIGPSKRAPVGTTMSLALTLGVISLAGVAWLIRDWVQLQLAVTLPFVVFLGYWWFLPESPRWLLSQGKFDETMDIVRRIAKVNGVKLRENYIEEMFAKYKAAKALAADHKQYDAFDLFRTPNLRKKTIVIIFDTFCVYSVYNGLNFFVPHLGSEEHISFLLASLVELPSYLVLYLTLNRFGRRPVLLLSMVLGGAFCILCSVVPENNDHLVKVTFLISKFCITCSYFVTDLFATELFPTVVRGAGASLSQTISAVGLCFSPLIAYFAHKLFYLPLLIFGLLSIVGGVVSMILPETVNQPLPETLEEGEEFGKTHRWTAWARSPSQSPASITIHQRRSDGDVETSRNLLGGNGLSPQRAA
ncbi:hypothetical protein RvY_14281 [Ramazzottius varieornatus]|uniref:Major facilitator superfamily (MFS) profile domain-containing protein n=1 Tax=Ramazzottius varieornatus TaxID=947166 RepID=A0A1D1VQQ8_RAMVA|nr:hypothetical protein RvY_14281 [Ramazzottius varieornatus]